MHAIEQFIEALGAPFFAATSVLMPHIGAVLHRGPDQDTFILAAFVVATAVVGFFCCWWAAWSHARLANYRIEKRAHDSHMRGLMRFRDALMIESGLIAVVLGNEMRTPMSIGGGNEMLQACMTGADAQVFAECLHTLLLEGTSFVSSFRIKGGRRTQVRGTPIGRRVALYFQEPRDAGEIDFPATLDAIPAPVWVRQHDLSLAWANRAYLDAIQTDSVENAQGANVFLGRDEHDLAMSARAGSAITSERRYVTIEGERRAFNVNLNSTRDKQIVGHAVDVTPIVRAQAQAEIKVTAFADLLDHMKTAVCGFSTDMRLKRFNRAFAAMWSLEQQWLLAKPTLSEIFDRLRDAGRLPEQRDFSAFKQQHLRLFDDRAYTIDTVWYAPNEKSIKVVARSDAEGNVSFYFEDVSEELVLRSKLALLTEVHRATLDTIEEGVAIFGANGKLVMHNSAFAKSWDLREDELASGPHFSRVAALCNDRKGRDGIWELVSAGIISGEPERYTEWGKVKRSDGRVLAVALARLPNGAIAVSFKDITDFERFTEELRKNPVIAA